MRVAFGIRVSVVLAVVGHPVEHRPLNRQGADDREDALDSWVGLERAMGEQAVKADGDPARGEQIEAGEQGEIGAVDPAMPQQNDGGDDAEERDDNTGEIGGLFGLGHA